MESPVLYTRLVGSDGVQLIWSSGQFCAGFCPSVVPATYYEIWTNSLHHSGDIKVAEISAEQKSYTVENLEPGIRREFFIIAKRADVRNRTNRVMVVPNGLPAVETVFQNEGFEYITHPQVSPDGKKIAYTVSKAGSTATSPKVLLYDLGQKSHSLVQENGMHPSWSASGDTLVFVSRSENTSTIKGYSIASGKTKEYVSDSFQCYFPVYGAKDGTLVYLLDSLDEGERGIIELDLAKNKKKPLREPEFIENASVPFLGMDYSGEKNTVAYSMAFPKETAIGFSFDVVGFGPGNPSALNNLVVSDWNDSNPSFSGSDPDLLAFVSDRSGLPQVWIKNVSTQQMIQVTDFQDSEWVNVGIAGLSWSADRLYVNILDVGGNTKLLKIDVSGLLAD